MLRAWPDDAPPEIIDTGCGARFEAVQDATCRRTLDFRSVGSQECGLRTDNLV